jgi:hypothetical protein
MKFEIYDIFHKQWNKMYNISLREEKLVMLAFHQVLFTAPSPILTQLKMRRMIGSLINDELERARKQMLAA